MDLSVVIPVYRCAETLCELCERLERELVQLPGLRDYEILLIEDGGAMSRSLLNFGERVAAPTAASYATFC